MRSVAIATSAVSAAVACGSPVYAFTNPRPVSRLQVRAKLSPSFMFFADSAADTAAETQEVEVTAIDGSDATAMENAAKFMVDAFWLHSPQQLIQGAGDSSEISDAARASLIATQADDLMSKYGERMGKRKLDALVLAASSDGGASIQGIITVEVRLLDKESDILPADASEFKLTQAVASLGPKQRREYKDASVIDIANQLLPPELSAVVVLANLCVSPSARRKGIAAKLCTEAELVAKNMGFDEAFLRVEAANEAAKTLYEQKLGYERVLEVDSATALRVDGNSGNFIEVESDIVVLKKKIL